MSGVHNGTTSVVKPDEFSKDDAVVDGELVVPEESLSFPEPEIVVCGREMVSRLWISVHVSATPVDSGVSVGTAGDVPEITMTVRDPDGPGRVKVCKTTLYDTEVGKPIRVSLPTDDDCPTTEALLLVDGVPDSETTGDGVSVVRVRD